MDNRQDIPEYIKKLPQSVQDLVFDGVWEERASEIAKKYSLDPNQTEELINSVLFILIGLDKPDAFLENIIKELSISRLLGEQITEDLEARVFEYAISFIESKNKPKIAQSAPVQSLIQPSIQVTVKPPLSRFETTKTLEIRPESLPAIEKESEDPNKISVPRYIPTNTYKPASSVQNNPVKTYTPPTPPAPAPTPVASQAPKVAPTITYRPKSIVPDQVQQITPVPRFTANTDSPMQNKPVPPQNPMENKLNNVTTNTLEKSVAEMLPPKGNVDPYREPLN